MKKIIIPLSGASGYLVTIAILHTPIIWLFWLGLACVLIIGLAFASVPEIAHLINAPLENAMRQIIEEDTVRIGDLTKSIDLNYDPFGLSAIDHSKSSATIPVSDDFHHFSEALRIMATAGKISIAAQHQEIEPYTPPPSDAMELWQIGKSTPVGYLDKLGRVYHAPEPLPRYEIVMHDDWQSRDTSDMPFNDDEKAVTPFSSDKVSD